jgi:hypothetical protein
VIAKGDKEAKRKLIIGWGMFFVSILMGVVAYFILD